MANKRKYDNSFIKCGFTSIINRGTVLPQCVICQKTLENEILKPSKLKLHLNSVHPNLHDKYSDNFKSKENLMKRARLDSGVHLSQFDNITTVSYEIALLTLSAPA